jgi:hypothetical protein
MSKKKVDESILSVGSGNGHDSKCDGRQWDGGDGGAYRNHREKSKFLSFYSRKFHKRHFKAL